VCAAIVPFNFPAMVPMWFLPFAIACGNAFILKPSEQVPNTQQLVFEIIDGLSLPPGVANLVNGGKDVVNGILEHPGIDAVSFVGSAAVAKHVYTRAAATGKRVQALGGAKNHMVVLPDAVMGKTVDGIIGSAFGAAGQRCMAGSVLVTVGEAHERVLERLQPATEALRVGDGMQEGVAIGPVVSKAAKERVEGWIDKGERDGAKVVVDGRSPEAPEAGAFVGPTIVEVEPQMEIAREEVFGPVLSVLTFDTVDEAIALANGTSYGLSAGVWSRDYDTCLRAARGIRAGTVWLNTFMDGFAELPFGGFGESGIGRELGRHAALDYTEVKTLQMHGGPRTAWWLPSPENT
jgi:malonate-semialdehyde dehydrogenase (acetylating)/methylmalonate-semialdehyde dehydrogenase